MSHFEPLINELKLRNFKVFCPDLPGFGQSEKPSKPLYLSDYVSFVDRYLKTSKLRDIILIGHSFGGRIAIKLAANNYTRIKSLILTGTPGINPVPRTKKVFFNILSKIGNMLFAIPIFSSFKNQARKILYKLAAASDFYNTDEALRQTFKNIVAEDLSLYLKDVKIPTLLIWGEDDSIVPVDIASRMSKLIPQAQLITIPNARHGVPWTHPKLFVDAMAKFLSNL